MIGVIYGGSIEQMSWSTSLSSHVWIFSVGRGCAAFIRSGLNQGFLVDMGMSDDFDPADFIFRNFLNKLDSYRERKIAQAVLSHPHSDHIGQCAELARQRLYPALLTCPNDKTDSEKLNWQRIKNPKGSDDLLAAYKGLYEGRSPPLQTILFDSKRAIPNLEYGFYYIRPPICEKLHESDDNKYGNATSVVFYYRHGQHTILLPGDMTPEGMSHLLKEEAGSEKRYTVFNAESAQQNPNWHKATGNQPSLKSLLGSRGLSILVAPHHGLESGFSEDLYSAMRGGKPELVVVSEKRHVSETDGKVDGRYQSEDGASGLEVEVDGKRDRRFSITTRNGHHMVAILLGTGRPKMFAHTDPEALLKKVNAD